MLSSSQCLGEAVLEMVLHVKRLDLGNDFVRFSSRSVTRIKRMQHALVCSDKLIDCVKNWHDC
jgi:hypothetical protein